MNTRTHIKTEVLSDGSKVYNVIVCSDTRFPDESTATYYCNDEKAAYGFASAIDAAVAKYCA